MTRIRGLLILAVPVVGLGLLGLAVSLRREVSPPAQAATKRASLAARPRSFERVEASSYAIPTAPPSRPLAPEAVTAQKMDEARVRSTYQNFRTAVATGNTALRDALGPVLKRDRDFAIGLAQEELSRANDDFSRSVAQNALEVLRR